MTGQLTSSENIVQLIDFNLNLNAKLISSGLDKLLSSRDITEVTYLNPRDIAPFFSKTNEKGYMAFEGMPNVHFGHIEQMIPGFIRPTDELIATHKETAKAYGTMPGWERSILLEMVRALRPRTVFEMGTQLGLLTNDLATVSPEDALVITMDLPMEKWDEARFGHTSAQAEYVDKVKGKPWNYEYPGSSLTKDPSLRNRIAQIEADTGNFDYSPFYGKMDVVIVDANHGKNSTSHDLMEAKKLVSPGGIVFIDDVNKMFRNDPVTYGISDFMEVTGATIYWANYDYEENVVDGNLAFMLNTPETFAPINDVRDATFQGLQYRIEALKESGLSDKEIASQLGFDSVWRV